MLVPMECDRLILELCVDGREGLGRRISRSAERPAHTIAHGLVDRGGSGLGSLRLSFTCASQSRAVEALSLSHLCRSAMNRTVTLAEGVRTAASDDFDRAENDAEQNGPIILSRLQVDLVT